MSRFPKKSPIATNRSKTGQNKLQVLITEAKRQQELRETTYRDRALKLFPLVCARCGQEFSGKRFKELTVHHKDHNHDNNPPDGSNWELLCERCHDKEHARYLEERELGEIGNGTELEAVIVNTPFVELETLLKDKK